MIIEIVGVDGSGKTTLAHGLRRAINESGQAFAYERNFQSDGVRLLEAAACGKERARPLSLYSREVIEYVRAVELVLKSFDLAPYAGSATQHVFTDSHLVEQAGRAFQYGLLSAPFVRLLSKALLPDRRLYLCVTPDVALERIQARPKGDALLLQSRPVEAIAEVIRGLESALSAVEKPTPIQLDGTLPPDALVALALEHIRNG